MCPMHRPKKWKITIKDKEEVEAELAAQADDLHRLATALALPTGQCEWLIYATVERDKRRCFKSQARRKNCQN